MPTKKVAKKAVRRTKKTEVVEEAKTKFVVVVLESTHKKGIFGKTHKHYTTSIIEVPEDMEDLRTPSEMAARFASRISKKVNVKVIVSEAVEVMKFD